METNFDFNSFMQAIDSLGSLGILAWLLYKERKRADDVTSEIFSDWRRQNDREQLLRQEDS